jgi:hypothetical protein
MAAFAPLFLTGLLNHAQVLVTTSGTVSSDSTLSPEGINPQGVAKWVDRVGGIAIGYPSVTLSVRPPTKASRVWKVTAKYVLPTLEQTSPSTATGIQPAPTKAYDLTCVMEWMLPERSTLAERQRLFSLVKTLFIRNISASGGSPNNVTGSPLETAVTTYENVY